MKDYAIPPSGDGAIVFFSAGRVRRKVIDRAFIDSGLGSCLPKREKRTVALREAISAYLKRGLTRRSNYELFSLDRRVLGFEIRELVKGGERNDHLYVMSVKVDASDNAWATVDGVLQQQHVSDAITALYRERLEWYSATSVGAFLVRAISVEWQGVGLRDQGGVYFISGSFYDRYRALARAIERSAQNPDSECVLHAARFPLLDNPTVARDALAAIRQEVRAAVAEINDDLVGAAEMRAHGVQTRIERLARLQAKIRGFEEMFQASLADLADAVETTRNSLALADLAAVSVSFG
jgi:hypothetical protein